MLLSLAKTSLWYALEPADLTYLSFFLKPSDHTQIVLLHIWCDQILYCASLYIVASGLFPRIEFSHNFSFQLALSSLMFMIGSNKFHVMSVSVNANML